jgi:hypothetical protein
MFQTKSKSNSSMNPIKGSPVTIGPRLSWGWLRIASFGITIIVAILFIYKVTQIIVLKESMSSSISDIYQVLAIGAGALLFTALAVFRELLTRKNRASEDTSLTIIDELTNDLAERPTEIQTRSELESYVTTLDQRLNTLRAKVELYSEKLKAVDSEISNHGFEVERLSDKFSIWKDGYAGIRQYADTAKQYMLSFCGATVLATVIGTYVSFLVLHESIFLLIAVNLVITPALIFILSSAISILTGAQPDNPSALKHIKILLGFSVFIFLAAIFMFTYMRFGGGGNFELLQGILLGAEFSLVFLAGALYSGYRIFSWARVYEEKVGALKEQREVIKSQLTQYTAASQMTERAYYQQEERRKSL